MVPNRNKKRLNARMSFVTTFLKQGDLKNPLSIEHRRILYKYIIL